jgi:hypothetical protein
VPTPTRKVRSVPTIVRGKIENQNHKRSRPTNPNYCIRCAEVHADPKTCPKRREYLATYTVNKSWKCAGAGANDLHQSDLKATGGYPEDLGHTVAVWQNSSRFTDDFDFGEPNCKIRMGSLVYNTPKEGKIGLPSGVDRETATIRHKDINRIEQAYAYIRNPKKETGIPTLD